MVAFAFGAPSTIRSNRWIARTAQEKAGELNAPVYTQLDIRVEEGIQVEYTEEEPGNPPPTLRIARGAAEWAKRRNLTSLVVVAAKPHLWRALRDVKEAVREAGAGAKIEVRACKEEIEQYPEGLWYCPDSTQERTRSETAWKRRERLLKAMPLFIYKRIAG